MPEYSFVSWPESQRLRACAGVPLGEYSQRKELSACRNTSSVREDQLIMIADQITRSIFLDADKFITMTHRDAEQFMAANLRPPGYEPP